VTVLVATSFALRSEGVPDIDSKLLQFFPPALAIGEKLQFDFTPLFVTDSMIMDATSYEALGKSSNPGIISFFKQIKPLLEEGFIKLRNYSELTQDERTKIKTANDHETFYPERWLPHIRNIITAWDAVSDAYEVASGNENTARLSYLIQDFLYESGQANNLHEAAKLRKIVYSKKTLRPRGESEVIRSLSRILMDHVHTNMLLRKKYNGSIYEWNNYRPVLTTKSESFLEDNPLFGDIRGCRQFLDFILPCALAEIDIIEIIKLLRDDKIGRVREMVLQYGSGNIDKNSISRMIAAALAKSNLRFIKNQKFAFWGRVTTALAGLIPCGSIIGEAVLTAAQIAAGEAIEKTAKPKNGPKEQQLADVICILHRHFDSK
jgi:hypothetical protein